MPKTRDITIRVPATVSQKAAERAAVKAKETAVVELQQEGELTFREAAAELELNYEQYLDLLARKGLPATHDDTDPTVLDSLRTGLHPHETSLP